MPHEPSEIVNQSQDQSIALFDSHGRVVEGGKIGDPLVSCEVIDGVLHMKHRDEYLFAGNSQGYWQAELKANVPERHERLRFVAISAPDNTKFRISLWDHEEQIELFADLEWIKCAYGAVAFTNRVGVLELQLSRIDN
ncbi:hypothetical protein BGZ83_007736 [Gryganskiella cystojenkinii]|nr:hypothetical protein BGZ83_007736 [Gryganskiella cystojenkinii]